MAENVRLDTSDFDRGVRQLTRRVGDQTPDRSRTAAQTTAQAIRARTPKRTGRLASTVSAVPVRAGWAVTYGGGLRYARPVAARTRNVAAGIAGQPDRYARSLRAMTETEVNRL